MRDIGEAAEQAGGGAPKGADRERVIIQTSVTGIAANVLLAAFKAAVGLLSHSIAITLDAVNNISDAASSVITIVGTRLAAREPDKKHPWGYGRVEYLTSMVISVIVLYAGLSALLQSVWRIFSPETPDYSPAALVVVAAGVIVKVLLGLYVKGRGKAVDSMALVNSGADALNDSVISAATLAAALLFTLTGLSLEAYLGAVIAVVIVKSGVDMLREAISKVLGERVDIETAVQVRNIIATFPEVRGSYDLIFNDYGTDRLLASVHIEVPDTMTAQEIDTLVRRITAAVYEKSGVLLTAVGIYSVNTQDKRIVAMRDAIQKIAFRHRNVMQLHGFYVNEETKTIQFDVVIGFEERDKAGLLRSIAEEAGAAYPDYRICPSLDRDFSLSE